MRFFLSALFCLLAFSEVKPSNGQHDCQILNYSTNIRIERGKIIQEKSFLIEINNNQGNWISEIEIPLRKGNKTIVEEAVILDQNNNVKRKLKKNEIVTTSDISNGAFYEDDMVMEFTLKWNEYPYLIRYSYKTTFDQFLYVAEWSPMVYRTIPTQEASLTIQAPQEVELLIHYPDTIGYNQSLDDGMIMHKWESAYKKKISKEVFAPNFYDCVPTVSVVPKDFDYFIEGSFASWKSFGDWQFEIIKALEVLTNSEKSKVDELIKGVSDKREIIQILYNYLQDNTRYINISIKTGGMVPYPAQYVCENKYGDCKALTIYMKALLNYAGIESFYTLIYGDDQPTSIIESFPSQQFNHVILCVPMEGDSIWLENTSKYAPFNYLGTFTQNRKGLLIQENGSVLVNTPKLTNLDVREKSNYIFDINKDGSGKLQLEQELGGQAFELLKYVELNYSDRDKKRFYAKYKPVQKSEMLRCEIEQERNRKHLRYTASYTLNDQIREIGNMYVIQLHPSIDFSLEGKEERTQDIMISYPIHQLDSIIYNCELMVSHQLKHPDDFNIETKYGSYSETYHFSNDQLTVKRHFFLDEGKYSVENYPEFHDFITSIEEAQKKSVIILKLN